MEHAGLNSDVAAEGCLFSVVTPSLNCALFIERNIESVRSQGIPDDQIEHWIIDGGSTDGTQDLLRKYSHIKWLSEKDAGLSDAVNKGVRRAKAEWILWLNADDQLAPDALKTFIAERVKHPEAKLFCGDEIIQDYQGNIEQVLKGWAYDYELLLTKNFSINQAATIVHRTVYDEAGLLRVEMRYAMDYEWTVRAVQRFKCVYIPAVLAIYRRRKGSIMDANLVSFYRDFIKVRRMYNRGRFEFAEVCLLLYIWTNPFRQIRWFRGMIRRVKRVLNIPTPVVGEI